MLFYQIKFEYLIYKKIFSKEIKRIKVKKSIYLYNLIYKISNLKNKIFLY